MKTIKEIMKAGPVTCGKNETLKVITNQMYKSNVGFLPVLDENKKVIGTITDRDVALAIGKNSKSAQDIKVHEVMNTKVYSVRPEDDAVTALKMMRTKKVGRLPVVDSEGKIKGVISLTRIANKIKDSKDKSELEHAGKENIINTIQSLAERTEAPESIEEAAE